MIYVFLADGFEETEALTTVDILRRGGCEVEIVSVKKDKMVTSSHKVTVVADININEVTKENLEGVILPGGMPGTLNLEKSETVKEYIKYCVENSLVIGAICAAPSVLGKMGILKNKNATCFPGFEEYLGESNFTGEFSVIDGKIVTGKGMGATIPFGLNLLKLFKDEETVNNVHSALQCPYK